MSTVRGRFAPTPSGRMHLGNVYCVLLSWLSVRAQNGTFILRIEDLDNQRCPMNENARILEEDLRWLGLDWDEGGSLGGPHESYYQSERFDYYREQYEAIQKQTVLYPCFCSRKDLLHCTTAPHASDGHFVYPGTCRHLSEAEREEKRQKKAPSMRLCVPDQIISFEDSICGTYAQNLKTECGDFIIRRADGIYAYQLAVVADDAAMGITEVIRGNDLLSSTPAQLYLYELMHKTPPHFAHIPLLVDESGRRLSKRDQDLDLGALRKRFSGPEPILGVLGYLAGLLPGAEPATAKELIPLFTLSKLPTHNQTLPASFRASIQEAL